MNIHFTNKVLKRELDESTIFEIEIGSGMYNLKTSESDTDILKIYLEGSLNMTSVIKNHHQFQYKDEQNNIDYIYTSLQQFVANILSGDSTVNYEVLYSERFRETFPKLFEAMNFHITNITKSYLGIAKRDLKILKKNFSNKKLYHFIRGVEFASTISSGELDIFNALENNYETLRNIRTDIDLHKDSDIISSYEAKMNKLRNDLDDIKLKSKQAYFIDYWIRDVYTRCKHIQLDFIDYNTLIVDAILEDKFGY